jgi:hypothetical protein
MEQVPVPFLNMPFRSLYNQYMTMNVAAFEATQPALRYYALFTR